MRSGGLRIFFGRKRKSALLWPQPAFRTRQRAESCVTITNSRLIRRAFVPDHISRKELKQDKIKETIEHGAEAVISHGQFTLIVVFVALVAALAYGGWRFYVGRQTVGSSAAFDTALKAFPSPHRATPCPCHPNHPAPPHAHPP